MTKTIIFIANGFNKDNIRLQPWRYIYELAKYKAIKHRVIIITEGSTEALAQDWPEGLCIIETNLLNVKCQMELGRYIDSLKPHELWWSTTPRSIAFFLVLRSLSCYKIAFITCPLYRWGELFRAALSGVPYEQTKALWAQRFVPRFIFRLLLNSRLFNAITVQSNNNKIILETQGVYKEKIYHLPVGIDEADVKPVDEAILKEVCVIINRQDSEVIFLYLGALRPIRGFNSLIKAFSNVVARNSHARLIVLARGSSEDKCNELEQELTQLGIGNNVVIKAGWLTREQVWSYIELSDIVVLPFILVPSDIPIAVLESLARGKPVVVSAVDGLPELAFERGIITDPLNTQEFADDLCALSEDKKRIALYTKSAKEFIKKYPRWNDVGQIMDNIIDGINYD